MNVVEVDPGANRAGSVLFADGGVGEMKGVGGITTAVVAKANGSEVGANAAIAESDLALQAVVAGRMSRRRITAVIPENAGNLIRQNIITKSTPP